ncbi:uncharacterized protein LOC131356269 [Hemibagrus wyckioides]|uniref:uncharacterized protein LOC131356269 n=1 Tax=Hemibagrus wyckioides TaxID=337641 RepID=UPI00266D0F20|nr:uncharacterized protein LOC131356269 [Hemibagrus wyckioides]
MSQSARRAIFRRSPRGALRRYRQYQLSCLAIELTGFLEHLSESSIPESPYLAHHIVRDTVCLDQSTQFHPTTCDQSTQTFYWHWTRTTSQGVQTEDFPVEISSNDSSSDSSSFPNSPDIPQLSPEFVPMPYSVHDIPQSSPDYSPPTSPTDYSPTSPQDPEIPSSTTDPPVPLIPLDRLFQFRAHGAATSHRAATHIILLFTPCCHYPHNAATSHHAATHVMLPLHIVLPPT